MFATAENSWQKSHTFHSAATTLICIASVTCRQFYSI